MTRFFLQRLPCHGGNKVASLNLAMGKQPPKTGWKPPFSGSSSPALHFGRGTHPSSRGAQGKTTSTDPSLLRPPHIAACRRRPNPIEASKASPETQPESDTQGVKPRNATQFTRLACLLVFGLTGMIGS
ncbi:hypothetical protein N657DRAFT_216624 [Parathielavia appendiculata]|uniref:Uncharacterized protein n=1 Tax=Parathielavia appendiculata TaxID=2587402 RepID=A0AAN6U6V2_9PEZI|nr:hypothetical protein N657DRAFT_216624 [Parathielavia appendiculata]